MSFVLKLQSCVLTALRPSGDGVETAEEAVEPAEPDMNELCADMFEKMAVFLQGELTGLVTDTHCNTRTSLSHRLFFMHAFPLFPKCFLATCEDYCLLENMNKLTSLKYMEMKDISINISRNLQDLNNKCE